MPEIKVDERSSRLYRLRHSLSHVLAQAVLRLYPGTKLAFGPPVEDGFYYDFLLPQSLNEEQLPDIEREMRRILDEKQAFEHEDLPASEAIARLEQMDQPFKVEFAKELAEEQRLPTLSFFRNGPFVDLCEGPHVENTSEIPTGSFRLHSVSGAYWRGDERNSMLTRIYGYAFEASAELKQHVAAVERAKQRDHRRLAALLGIYTISDSVGKGLPLWMPNGTAIRMELEKLAYEMEHKGGYVYVATPHIARRRLYETSGHIPLYEASMFPPMSMHEEDEVGERPKAYYLKPMNCPHHHMIFAAEPRSYRDLPLRLSEYGSVYRFERGGQLQGLTRVRGMTMNDAHIYVTPEQLKDEFQAVMELHRGYYDLFGFKDYYLRLSLWDPDDPKRRGKYVDAPEAWAHSEGMVRQALDELGLHYTVEKGEAAFYGPKVDFQFRTVTGREFTLSTNQLDFAVPPRFNLQYVDRDGEMKHPFVIHRAPLGTHERFIAFLLEHFGGAFPTWLAPVQVRIVPISDELTHYGRSIERTLRNNLVRVALDASGDTINKKIRSAITLKTPIILVVGKREAESNTVTVRRYGSQRQETMAQGAFMAMLLEEIRTRRHLNGGAAMA